MNSSIFFSFWFFIRYIIVHICELSLISIGVHLLVEHQRHLKQNGNIHHVIILYIYIIIYSDLLSLVCFVFQINSIWSIPFYYPGFVFWIWQKYLSIFLHLQKRWFQMCKFCRSLTKVAYTDQTSCHYTRLPLNGTLIFSIIYYNIVWISLTKSMFIILTNGNVFDLIAILLACAFHLKLDIYWLMCIKGSSLYIDSLL